jgi:hypothetical protein
MCPIDSKSREVHTTPTDTPTHIHTCRHAILTIDFHSSRRGETVIIGLSLHMLSYIFDRIFSELSEQSASYFGVVFTQMFGTFSQPLNVSWMSLTCDDSEQRALAMAL